MSLYSAWANRGEQNPSLDRQQLTPLVSCLALLWLLLGPSPWPWLCLHHPHNCALNCSWKSFPMHFWSLKTVTRATVSVQSIWFGQVCFSCCLGGVTLGEVRVFNPSVRCDEWTEAMVWQLAPCMTKHGQVWASMRKYCKNWKVKVGMAWGHSQVTISFQNVLPKTSLQKWMLNSHSFLNFWKIMWISRFT